MVYGEDIRNEVVKEYVNGSSLNSLAEMYPNISKKTLSRWIARLKLLGHVKPFKACGRPPKYSARDIRHLKTAARLHPKETAAQIAERAGVSMTRHTVSKYLKQTGIFSIIVPKKQLLTPWHASRRLLWANEHRNLVAYDWQKWIFSDECSVQYDCTEGLVRMWLMPSEKYGPQAVRGTLQQGGGRIMIWGLISWDGVGPLIFVEGTMDGDLYKEVLKHHVEPLLVDLLMTTGEVHTYMDDNAPCHRTNDIEEYCDQRGIKREWWPARSPDMNPIENLWSWIKQKLARLDNKPRTLQELKEKIEEIWYQIPVEYVRTLISSMPRRIGALRQAKGWNTKY